MASVAVTERAHLTAQVWTVGNQCVVSGHSKTWFMTSTPWTAVALLLPNHNCLFPTARTFGLMLGSDYGTGGHLRDSVCKSIADLRQGSYGTLAVLCHAQRTKEQGHFGTSIRRPECLRKDTPHH
jgi:hypothetical protein